MLDFCNEEEIHEIADAMVANGMLALGYKLILLDDCWANTSRDVNGDLHPDPARFPSGIAPLVKYVEDRGFYLGLYTCAGTETCVGGRPGSKDHWPQDAAVWAEWGVDWMKVRIATLALVS